MTDISSTVDAREDGRSRRGDAPRSSHADWTPVADRRDPVAVIEEQNAGRVDQLVPLRRGRMSASPFAFYRGSAAIMASDLAATPTSGLEVQLSGDAHLSNFGVYGSPERNLVFDLNDFDETLPGPFEWDVKRLATSFAIAAQDRGFDADVQRSLAERAVAAYRTVMRRFDDEGWLAVWYEHVDEARLSEWTGRRGLSQEELKRLRRFSEKARSRDALHAATKLVDRDGDAVRFRSSPPVLVRLDDLTADADLDPDAVREGVGQSMLSYLDSLTSEIRHLVTRYRVVDVALKVVGVGSVGTRCWIVLLAGRVDHDVLILQVKEATASVLEAHLPASRFDLHGRRVVEGQQLMQASSDIFLGWSRSTFGRDYYWRQFKDWKGSARIERATPSGLERYAELCGYTLARAHAVSGDPGAIAAYLGKGRNFDRAVGEFAMGYAAQNQADHEAFVQAIDDGLEVERDT
jgi:uncharacterized protein (DUF2252 family)